MFSKKKGVIEVSEKPSSSTGTIIGEGIVIEAGKITGKGNVRIDGRFSGNISIENNIIVGKSGHVDGEIKAESALFAGHVDGNITINNTVHLAEEAHVTGQILTDKIVVDEGAVFNGSCNMNNGQKPVLTASTYIESEVDEVEE